MSKTNPGNGSKRAALEPRFKRMPPSEVLEERRITDLRVSCADGEKLFADLIPRAFFKHKGAMFCKLDPKDVDPIYWLESDDIPTATCVSCGACAWIKKTEKVNPC